MKTAIYSFHKFEKPYWDKIDSGSHLFHFFDLTLTVETARLTVGFDAVSLFVSDDASASVLEILHANGIRFIALRSAGYNNVDMVKAKQLGIRVARVPAYSPFAVAEHAVALMLALNRKLIRSHYRIMEQNFSLDGLTGFDMNGKTVGIAGTGKIGKVIARILHGFGCHLLAYDKIEDEEIKQKYEVEYVDFEMLCNKSDIITLHLPLNQETKHLINNSTLDQMKEGVMLINTSRGALVNTKDVVQALKRGRVGYFGMDVYEEEGGLFFEDHSDNILQDDTIARLMTFQNVLITSHQGFLTETSLQNITKTTIYNLDCFEQKKNSENEIK
ncbi:MAG: 2-hydroxyacid dehydrogenase [Bacteroidia bacterium]|nr:2-hydroxyacid dehydrogenase [Bacteroidia bacterium]